MIHKLIKPVGSERYQSAFFCAQMQVRDICRRRYNYALFVTFHALFIAFGKYKSGISNHGKALTQADAGA
jgi:hypothetical protein